MWLEGIVHFREDLLTISGPNMSSLTPKNLDASKNLILRLAILGNEEWQNLNLNHVKLQKQLEFYLASSIIKEKEQQLLG